MFFLKKAFRNAKHLPESGAVSVDAHCAARAQVLRALPDAVFESAPRAPRYVLGIIQSFIYKPVVAGVAAFVSLAGGWMTTSAAQTSLPGDTLYQVKLITERAQLQVASLDRRAVLHTEFAGRRLEEVAELQRVVDTEPERAHYIDKTVIAYQEEITSATTQLHELQEQNQPETLTTAVIVLDKVALLTESAEFLSNVGENSTQQHAEVVETTDAIAHAATDVALNVHESTPSQESTHELGEVFRATLGDIEVRRAMVQFRITKLMEVSSEQKEVLAQAGVVFPKKSVFTDMVAQLDAMDKNIPVLMNGFASGGYRSALSELGEMERAISQMESSLALVEDMIVHTLMEQPTP